MEKFKLPGIPFFERRREEKINELKDQISLIRKEIDGQFEAQTNAVSDDQYNAMLPHIKRNRELVESLEEQLRSLED